MSGDSQDTRHSKPQWGHLYVLAPDGGLLLSKQFRHRKAAMLLPLAGWSAVGPVSSFKMAAPSSSSDVGGPFAINITEFILKYWSR